MAYTQRIAYETIRSVDTATAGSFVVLGTALAHNASIVKIVNLSNKDLLISVDGTNTVDICPAVNFFLYDVSAAQSKSVDCFFQAKTQFYVKTSDGAAGTGLVYLVVLYPVVN